MSTPANQANRRIDQELDRKARAKKDFDKAAARLNPTNSKLKKISNQIGEVKDVASAGAAAIAKVGASIFKVFAKLFTKVFMAMGGSSIGVKPQGEQGVDDKEQVADGNEDKTPGKDKVTPEPDRDKTLDKESENNQSQTFLSSLSKIKLESLTSKFSDEFKDEIVAIESPDELLKLINDKKPEFAEALSKHLELDKSTYKSPSHYLAGLIATVKKEDPILAIDAYEEQQQAKMAEIKPEIDDVGISPEKLVSDNDIQQENDLSIDNANINPSDALNGAMNDTFYDLDQNNKELGVEPHSGSDYAIALEENGNNLEEVAKAILAKQEAEFKEVDEGRGESAPADISVGGVFDSNQFISPINFSDLVVANEIIPNEIKENDLSQAEQTAEPKALENEVVELTELKDDLVASRDTKSNDFNM